MQEPTDTPIEDIGGRARTAAGWRFLSMGISTALQTVTSVLLARLLMPEDFGIIAMAAMVTGLAAVFQELGLGQALIQRKEISDAHTRSAFWGTLAMALMLYAAIFLLAPYAGRFFDEPRMVMVLRISSLTFIVTPFAVVPRSLLQRNMDFKTPFFAGLCGNVSYGAIGITMALLGYGYWALVGASVGASLIGTVALCILTAYLPPLIPSYRGLRDLFAFGAGVTGVGLFNYIAGQLDYLIVGRKLDAGALGLYRRAFTLTTLPLFTLSATLYPILFSAFSTLQDDDARAQRAYSRIITILGILGWPMLALLLVTAHEFIPLVFGEQWTGAVVPTQILVIAGMIKLITNPSGAAAKARGARFAYGETWRQAVRAVLIGAGAWYGSNWGIMGVAWAIALVQIVWAILMIHLVYRAMGVSLKMYLAAFRGPITVTILILLASAGVRIVLIGVAAAPALTLIASIVAGTVVGIAATLMIPWPELLMVREELGAMRKRLSLRKV